MKRKYFDPEEVFGFIWNSADSDGNWGGDSRSLAKLADLSERSAQAALDELCRVRLIEMIGVGKFAIVDWRDIDPAPEEEEPDEEQEESCEQEEYDGMS